MSTNTALTMIRDATLEDVDLVAEFNRLLAWESEAKVLDKNILLPGVRRAIADGNLSRYFIAENDGRPVGQTMLTFEWSDWRNGLFWWIQSVYVIPEFRRQGVFRALYKHIYSLAQKTPGICGIRLYVEEHNHRAHATYENMGMIKSGHFLLEHDWSNAVQSGKSPSPTA